MAQESFFCSAAENMHTERHFPHLKFQLNHHYPPNLMTQTLVVPASGLTIVPEVQQHLMLQVKRPEQCPLFNPGRPQSLSCYCSALPNTQGLCSRDSPRQLPVQTCWKPQREPFLCLALSIPLKSAWLTAEGLGFSFLFFLPQFPSSLLRSCCQNLITHSVCCLISLFLVPTSSSCFLFSIYPEGVT